MKKLNVKALTETFNRFRSEHLQKTYTSEEIIEALRNLGFNKGIAWNIISSGYIKSEAVGGSKLYSFQKVPLHYEQLESLYKKARNKARGYLEKSKVHQAEVFDEQAALALLNNRGYRIQKEKGFDLERFKKEQPAMYQKYVIYEIV